ncbi:MAG TPA: hypothetical protein PKB10_12340, partial [Tepidisphaeraceae bacterium]|nr:hypothetical protein [Tepidisphaeraceae bacterium]
FVEPLGSMLPADVLRESLRRHDATLGSLYHECGASITWGRSIGALSIALSIEWAAAGLAHGFGPRARHLGVLQHAIARFTDGFDAGLTTAHRMREQDGYRGIARLMQMTLDLLGKASFAAVALGEAPDTPHPEPVELFADRDELIRFEPDGAAVWTYRNAHLAFALPLVGRATADYAPTPHSPGLLDTPVDSALVSLLPRVLIDGMEFAPTGRPTHSEHTPAALHVEHRFVPLGKPQPPAPPFTATRSARYRVEQDTIHCDEEWSFERAPDAITFSLPECDRPLDLRIESSTAVHHARLRTDGMGRLRSHWSQIRRLHECTIAPAPRVRLSWSVRPAVRVTITPGQHDYISALVDATEPDRVAWHRPAQKFCPIASTMRNIVGDCDIFHIGWPEHLLSPHGLTPEELQQRHERLIEELRAAGIRIVWTMHNRLPHKGEIDRGRALYEAWARGADGLIHHSECGMRLMRAELPYRERAIHRVIPHGHFGRQMQGVPPREQIEREYGLASVPIRLGVLGRPQRTKNIDMIIRAFIDADRADQQLILTAHPEDLALLDHPRVRLLERPAWLTRGEIARHTALCDALILAHDGPTYLTSGIPADAIGLGVGLIGPDWAYLHEHCGDGCIYHKNTQDSLCTVFRSLTVEQIADSKRKLTQRQSVYDWNNLAAMTYDLYRAVRLARA